MTEMKTGQPSVRKELKKGFDSCEDAQLSLSVVKSSPAQWKWGRKRATRIFLNFRYIFTEQLIKGKKRKRRKSRFRFLNDFIIDAKSWRSILYRIYSGKAEGGIGISMNSFG